MSKMRLKKPSLPVKTLLAVIVIATSSAAYAAESIDQLASRIGMDKFQDAIKKGDRNAFRALPAKGYKDGFTGLLNKTNTYINPEYSFADCDTDTVFVSVKEHKTIPGCRISLKLASKNADGSYHDNGIRVEYGIATGSKSFIANNSIWAKHVISGDKVLEKELTPSKSAKQADSETVCTTWGGLAKNIAVGRDHQDPQSMFDKQIEGLRSNPDVTEANIKFAHFIAHSVYNSLARNTPEEAQAIIYNFCRKNM